MSAVRMHILPVMMTLALLVACDDEPVARDELIGNWQLDERTRQYLPPDLQQVQLSLSLEPDGQFSSQQIPGSIFFGVHPRNDLLFRGGGTWTLDDSPNNHELVLTFMVLQPPNVVPTPFVLHTVSVARRDGRPWLYFYPLDPDAGPKVGLRKQ